VQIFLSPLRDRLDDIPPLASHFLHLFRKQGRTRITEISPAALEIMKRYTWPGNIRELRAALERVIIYANYNKQPRIEREDLPFEVSGAPAPDGPKTIRARLTKENFDLDKELARIELSYVEDALRLTEERKMEAWKLLGLNDRFALLRRTMILLRAYPDLAFEFPVVQKLYGRSIN
jgi:two-component system response regulator AtoC